MLEHAAEGIIAVNDKRKIMFVNVSGGESIRMDPRSAVGMSIDAILRPVLVEDQGEVATPLADPLPLVSDEGLWAVTAASAAAGASGPSSLIYYTGVVIPSNEGKDVFMVSILPSPNQAPASSSFANTPAPGVMSFLTQGTPALKGNSFHHSHQQQQQGNQRQSGDDDHQRDPWSDLGSRKDARSVVAVEQQHHTPSRLFPRSKGSAGGSTPKLHAKGVALSAESLAVASAAAVSSNNANLPGTVMGPDDPFSADPRVVVTVDAANLVIVANPAACAFFSLRNASHITGESVGELFATGDSPFTPEDLDNVIAGKAITPVERDAVALTNAGSVPVVVRATVATLPFIGNKVVGIVIAERPSPVRKKAQLPKVFATQSPAEKKIKE
jgi:hypothetical protein